jgi:hypothetical protein
LHAVLQLADLHAQRGLSHIKLFCGTGNVAGFDNACKVLQLAKADNVLLRVPVVGFFNPDALLTMGRCSFKKHAPAHQFFLLSACAMGLRSAES